MWSVHDAEAALARRLRVGVTDVQALQVLTGRDVGTVELGAALGIRSASATALADRLQAAGHLRRAAHPTDGRRVVLELTASARVEVLTALRPLLDAIDGVVADLDDAEQVVVHRFLRRATGAVTEFAADAR